jgi:uncharacterized protein YndB with AHSA1/START domain
MSRIIKPAPIQKTVTVQASPQRAFEVFTDRLDTWWPRTHHIGAAALKRAVLEPKVGGRWYEIGEDGSECLWGDVLVWEPPTRLVLAWRIGADFKFDPDLTTEVEVNFTTMAGGATRVDFEHRLLENMGEGAARVRESLNNGWAPILETYAQVASQA